MLIDTALLKKQLSLNTVNTQNGFMDSRRNHHQKLLLAAAELVNHTHQTLPYFADMGNQELIGKHLLETAKELFYTDDGFAQIGDIFGLSFDYLTRSYPDFNLRFQNATSMLSRGLSQEKISDLKNEGGFNTAAKEFEASVFAPLAKIDHCIGSYVSSSEVSDVSALSKSYMSNTALSDDIMGNVKTAFGLGDSPWSAVRSVVTKPYDDAQYDKQLEKHFVLIAESALEVFSPNSETKQWFKKAVLVAYKYYVAALKELEVIKYNFGSNLYRSSDNADLALLSLAVSKAEAQIQVHAINGFFDFDVYLRYFAALFDPSGKNYTYSTFEKLVHDLNDEVLLPMEYVLSFAKEKLHEAKQPLEEQQLFFLEHLSFQMLKQLK